MFVPYVVACGLLPTESGRGQTECGASKKPIHEAGIRRSRSQMAPTCRASRVDGQSEAVRKKSLEGWPLDPRCRLILGLEPPSLHQERTRSKTDRGPPASRGAGPGHRLYPVPGVERAYLTRYSGRAPSTSLHGSGHLHVQVDDLLG
jgi:hypothetical protein